VNECNLLRAYISTIDDAFQILWITVSAVRICVHVMLLAQAVACAAGRGGGDVAVLAVVGLG